MSEPLPSADRPPDPQRPAPPDLDVLLAAARGERADTARAEFGFETRLLARLRERRRADASSVWAMVTWRMAPFFAAALVVLALWDAQLAAHASEAFGATWLQQPDAAELVGGMP
ncbi:MAG: hypothetical protein WDO13_18370 [Verrucomicrobiota bacterium]